VKIVSANVRNTTNIIAKLLLIFAIIFVVFLTFADTIFSSNLCVVVSFVVWTSCLINRMNE